MSHSISQDRGARDGKGADTTQQAPADDGGVEVRITEIKPNQFTIVATATFDQPVAKVWSVFRNFEKLVDLALPGLATDFEWLDGGSPGRVPSQFRFVANGETLIEEIYHHSDDEYVLRYLMLEPALGIESFAAGNLATHAVVPVGVRTRG